MRLELAERLICPAAHEATPLIVLAQETRERDLRTAQLGCMLCRRAGELRDGSVRLGSRDTQPRVEPPHVVSDDALLRLAALLGLDESHALVLLGGRYASFASPLAEAHDAIMAVIDVTGASPLGVGYIEVTEHCVPFSSGTFNAAALDGSMSANTLADTIRCVRVGGRVVGDASVSVPHGVRELARDAAGWVGEVEAAASPVIPLRRA
jgi:hypothetical protein